MKNVGIVAVSDYCRNVADDDEIVQLRADLDHREQVLAERAVKLAKSAPAIRNRRAPIVVEHRHFA